jgi:hypothetical protein
VAPGVRARPAQRLDRATSGDDGRGPTRAERGLAENTHSPWFPRGCADRRQVGRAPEPKPEHHPYLDTFVDQIHQPVREAQLELHLRVAREELAPRASNPATARDTAAFEVRSSASRSERAGSRVEGER